ncbi:alpha/beta-hydrolase [Daldinia caldariorum]|uniref:alpha/beta-hydrolase n=1 Tax=Daldinia caldariorum TaxID=326644 RepID=UPI0020081EB4|nr:alpha/beta-hydrolase [Daldinia caldariorum]KAI1469417.1 alpha/beta-hydrolase [Daldinia caldariorum]
MELGCSVIAPLAPHKHTHTVIFLHGRGDTSRNMADAMLSRWSRDSRGRSLIDEFPSVRWVFPEAELRAAETLEEMWPQWFDVSNMLDLTDSEELQVFGLRSSIASIRRIVRREARVVGGMDRVVLAGVSQGGATAFHTLLHLDNDEDNDGGGGGGGGTEGGTADGEFQQQAAAATSSGSRLCGIMGFSCWLPFPGGSLEETREVLGMEGGWPRGDAVVRNTPAFLGHCADDSLVFVEYGRQLRSGLRSFGMSVEWHEYEDGGHWINAPKGIDDAVEFLKAQGIPLAEADEEGEGEGEKGKGKGK